MRNLVSRMLVLVLVLVLDLHPGLARADELADANNALSSDRPNDAIATLESLGDRGVIDAAVSFDRGLAYSARVRAGGEQPGDLGRAAHGFEEARSLARTRALANDAGRALSVVRAEIARRRARSGETAELDDGNSLGRSIVELLPENVWSILAAAFAAALAIGIIVAARAKVRRARVGGGTAAAIGLAGLLATSLIVHSARDARLHLREAVVVSTARLLDSKHVALDGTSPIYEGTRLRLIDDDAEYAHVSTGRAEGWLPAGAVLPIAKRP